MKPYFAVIASIVMLATTAALGRDRAAVLTGIGKTAAYGTPANNGIQATGATQSRIDHKTLSAMQTSATPTTGVILTAVRGGGTMSGRGGAMMPSRGGAMMPGRGGAMMPGGFSSRPNWGHSPMMNGGFAGRPNWGHGFNSRPFVGRSFDRDDFFFHRSPFFDRDDFFFRNHFFPHDQFFFHRSPFFDRDDFFFRNHFFPHDQFFFHRSPFFDRDDFFFVNPFFGLSFSW